MSVRTVHTSFTTNEWTPMNKYPPGLGVSYPSAMSSSPSLTRRRSGTFIDHNSNVVGNGIGLASLPPPSPRRRMPLSRLPYTSSNYNPPTQQLKFDPFASDDAPSQAWASSKSSQKSPQPASHYTIQLPNLSTRSLPLTNNKPLQQRPPPQPVPVAAPKPDRNARAKIVAGILLNRIYAVGKPMRRRMASSFGSKNYVPSGLSSVITVEC